MPVSWNIIGNRPVLDRLAGALQQDRLHHAYLFTGPPHIGKTTAARQFAQAVLCSEDQAPCGQCAHCTLFAAGNHPDYLELPEEGTLTIAAVRDLKSALTLKPHSASHRVALVPHAERLGIPAQNALLKLLEEPPAKTVLLLTAPSTQALLPTTVSRCQHLSFVVPQVSELEEALAGRREAAAAIRVAIRRPGLALQLLDDPEQLERRGQWAETLATVITADPPTRLKLAAELAKEESLGDLLDYWLAYHREALHATIGSESESPSEPAAVLAKHYSAAQLRHNAKALFAARERLGYNPNVLLLMENTLLTLGE